MGDFAILMRAISFLPKAQKLLAPNVLLLVSLIFGLFHFFSFPFSLLLRFAFLFPLEFSAFLLF